MFSGMKEKQGGKQPINLPCPKDHSKHLFTTVLEPSSVTSGIDPSSNYGYYPNGYAFTLWGY